MEGLTLVRVLCLELKASHIPLPLPSRRTAHRVHPGEAGCIHHELINHSIHPARGSLGTVYGLLLHDGGEGQMQGLQRFEEGGRCLS